MRKSHRALLDNEALAILEREEYGVLSTCLNNQPYGVPLNYAFLDGAVYIHCATEGQKLEYLAANPKVSFCVVGTTHILPKKFSTLYESVILFGTAVLVTDPEERTKGLIGLVYKYSPEFVEEGRKYIENSGSAALVYRIDPHTITGKGRRSE